MMDAATVMKAKAQAGTRSRTQKLHVQPQFAHEQLHKTVEGAIALAWDVMTTAVKVEPRDVTG